MAVAIGTVQTIVSAASNTTSLVSSSKTVALGDIFIVTGHSENNTTTDRLGTVTDSSSRITWTKYKENVTATTCSAVLWYGVATSAGTTTITVAGPSGANWHSATVWQITGGQLAATPAFILSTAGGSAPSVNITTTGANSLVIASHGDFNARSPAGVTYRSSGAQDGIHDKSPTFYTAYYYHQAVATAGAVAVGQTAPTGQAPSMVAIEIQLAGGTNASVSPGVVAAAASIPTPTLSTGSAVSAAVVVALTSIPTPAMHTGATVTAAAVACQVSIPTPVVGGSAVVTASVVAAATTIPTPVVHVGSTVAAAVVAGSTSVPTPTVTFGATATPAVVACSTTVPTPTVSTGGVGTYTGFGAADPGLTFGGPDTSDYKMATAFKTSLTGQSATAGRMYIPATATGSQTDPMLAELWSINPVTGYADTILASGSIANTSVVVGGWNRVPFTIPFTVTAGTNYLVSCFVNGNLYGYISSYFVAADVPAPSGAAGLTMLQDTSAHHDGQFHGGGASNAPDSGGGTFYGVDIELNDGGGSSDANVTPTVVAAVTSVPTPVVTSSAAVTAAVVAAATTVPTPTVTVTSSATATPGVVACTVTVPTPTVSTAANATVSASVVAVTASIPTPVMHTGETVTGSVVAATTTIPTPTVTTAGNANVTAAVVACSTSVPTPVVATGTKTAPAVVAAAVTIPTPTVTTTTYVTPAVVAAVASIPTLTGQQDATATPSVVACAVTIPTPTVTTTGSSTATPAVVAAQTTIPTPALHTSVTITATVVAASTSIPTPTSSTTINAAVVACAVSVPVPTLHVGVTITVSVVAVSTSIPTPGITAGGNAAVNATAVACTVAIPVPTASGSATATPIRVLATASIPTPSVHVGVTATPAVVAVVTTIPRALVALRDIVISVGPALTPYRSGPSPASGYRAGPGLVDWGKTGPAVSSIIYGGP